MAGKTINFTDEADLLRQSGMMFLSELRAVGSSPEAPEGMRKDWTIVAEWLEHTSGDLTSQQSEKLEKAWIAYLAIGLAPSVELQSAFQHYSEQFPDQNKADRAPTAVMNVFDRLLATDAQIKLKRTSDLKAVEERFRPHFDKLRTEAKSSWWRQQPPMVRNWIFGATVWAAFMLVYAFFFDPFDVGGWKYMDDLETTQLALIALAPVAAGVVAFVYRKWVR